MGVRVIGVARFSVVIGVGVRGLNFHVRGARSDVEDCERHRQNPNVHWSRPLRGL